MVHQIAGNKAVKAGKVAAGVLPALVIHIFTFNRPDKFARLWTSLMAAQQSRLPTSLVIHVDYDAKRSDEWQRQVADAKELANTICTHGPVAVIFAARPKGLRDTMLEAWSPMPGEYAMFLEDDIEVSPLLLVFAERFILAYGEEDRDRSVIGFKLYNQKWDEVNQRMENPVNNGHVPFKIQEPCSWGTIFVPDVYADYLAWYVANTNPDPFIPRAWSNTWDPRRSAKKYLQRFMWEQGVFLIAINLPDHLSLTSPRIDQPGTNMKEEWLSYLRDRLEVPLLTSGEDNFWSAYFFYCEWLYSQHLRLFFLPAQGDVELMRAHGVDPFLMPKTSSLILVNATHQQVPEIKLPTAEEIAAISTDTLPPKELLDPSSARGARWRLLERGLAEVKSMLSEIRPRQLSHAEISPKQDAALRELLVSHSFF